MLHIAERRRGSKGEEQGRGRERFNGLFLLECVETNTSKELH